MSQNRPTKIEVDKYADSYAQFGDQSRAWRSAFPESRCKMESVHVKASGFHRLVKVRVRIRVVESRLQRKATEEFLITTSEIKKMLVEIIDAAMKLRIDARGNVRFVNPLGAIAAIHQINLMDGNYKKRGGSR